MKNKNDDRFGCALAFYGLALLLSLGWISFLVWAVYSIVSWLVTK